MKRWSLLILMTCLLVFSSSPAEAGSAGLVGISAHYSHPLTGAVEDPGNDAAIGQGMTETVLGSRGLYEVDDGGKQYLTMRIHLADQIGNMSFAVQNRGDSGFYSVNYSEMARSGDTVDVRIPISASDAIVRLEIYVNPMGRAVIFYGALNGQVTAGSGDFTVSVSEGGGGQTATAAAQSTSAKTSKAAPAGKAPAGKNSADKKAGEKSNKSKESSKKPVKSGNNATAEPEEQIEGEEGLAALEGTNDFGNDHGLLTEDSPELASLRGGEVDNTPWGVVTRALVTALIVVISIITTFLVLGAVLMAVGLRWLRRRNDWKEAALYDLEEERNA